MELTILHTNDFHGKLDAAKADAIRRRKEDWRALYFDCGDCIKAGNLAVPLREDPAWALLEAAGCDAGTLGNRETHILAAAFKAKIAGARHPLLCANLRTKSGELVLPPSKVFEHEGVRVGVVGVMVPMVTERMATQSASAYLWDPPIARLNEEARRLRPEVDLLIALTHIGHRQDLKAAEECRDVDLILGGHSHTIIESPERVGNAWVCQAGSHGRYLGAYRWKVGAGLVDGRLEPLA